MGFEIGRIGVGDGARLRAVRLAALAEAPGAFWQTHAGEAGRPPRDWDRRAARGSAGDAHATFLLRHSGEPVGMVNVHRPTHAPDFRELAAMWVGPAVRGTGAADLLLTTALDWARSVDAIGVRLWVEVSNPAAQRLYLRHGFTQIRRPEREHENDEHRTDPAAKAYLPMALPLTADAAGTPAFLDQATAPWTDESD